MKCHLIPRADDDLVAGTQGLSGEWINTLLRQEGRVLPRIQEIGIHS